MGVERCFGIASGLYAVAADRWVGCSEAAFEHGVLWA